MQRLLILGKVWPEPASSAAGSRMMQLIAFFLARKYSISFACAANKSDFSAELESIGVTEVGIELNHSSFDVFVKALQPDLVLFDRFSTEEQYGWRLAAQCPDSLRILDTEDLHSLRHARHMALKEKNIFAKKDLNNDVSKREIASIFRCDLSLIISDFEISLLRDHFKVPSDQLMYLPFLLDGITREQTLAWPSFTQRSDFISIGNFLHEPNWDAVLFLKENIWPGIRKQLPKASLQVYGAYPTQKVFQLHNPAEGFLIKGRASDSANVMRQARVCLAPLRFGAGLKGKLAEAMQCGTPNVTTAIGAEGMQGNLSWSGEIANNAEEIISAAVRLYTNEELWKNAQHNGVSIIHALFSKTVHEKNLHEKIDFLHTHLHQHRENNFTGAMLMHHFTLSSRYMALWIEAKNKETINQNDLLKD